MLLPILEHTLTPEQAFGAASTLVAQGSTIGSSANYGALFQIAVLVIALSTPSLLSGTGTFCVTSLLAR
jgi:hypothetical protein